jgi:hypothetical protein
VRVLKNLQVETFLTAFALHYYGQQYVRIKGKINVINKLAKLDWRKRARQPRFPCSRQAHPAERLADRLGKGPLSLEEALRAGTEICGVGESALQRCAALRAEVPSIVPPRAAPIDGLRGWRKRQSPQLERVVLGLAIRDVAALTAEGMIVGTLE